MKLEHFSRQDEIVVRDVLDAAGRKRTYHLQLERERLDFEELVHDAWYSFDSILYDDGQQTLTLVLRHFRNRIRWKRRRFFPMPSIEMRWQSEMITTFAGVLRYSLDDEAHIGAGDVGRVSVFSESVTLEGGLPVSLTIVGATTPVATILALPPEQWSSYCK